MNFVNMLTSSSVIVAIMVFALMALGEPFLESWLHRVFARNPPFQWGWDQFFAPLLRATMIVVFVYLAFPAIFGLMVAPTIGELLQGEHGHVSGVLGVLFICGFLASLVPGLASKPEFILPLQGCLACGYLFFELTSYLGVTTANLWPGLDILITMMCISYGADRLGRVFGKACGDQLDRMLDTSGYDLVIVHAIGLLAQIPVILLFGQGLGRQLAI